MRPVDQWRSNSVGIVMTLALGLFGTSSYTALHENHPVFVWVTVGSFLALDSFLWFVVLRGKTASSNRLKIIEARYGIDGGPDPEVTKQYLEPRIGGDSLAGFVGADLFGAFQPVTGGLPKRVKIRYLFDGKESIVERPEHAMLVLPEDKFLLDQIAFNNYEAKQRERKISAELSRAQEAHRQCEEDRKSLEQDKANRELEITNVPQSPLGIPALSSLLGQSPATTFDPKKWFALAYYSPVTAEVEKNIKLIADQNYPTEREAFYMRFIGVGIVAYAHEFTWALIFRSQIEVMEELSSRGLMPISDVRKHYDAVLQKHPDRATYSFEDWLGFLQSRLLLVKYPSEMVELSWNGKDFLKYLAHAGHNANERKY
jgi:hypothetical protein